MKQKAKKIKLLSFKSIKTNLVFWFLLLALVPLFIGILISFSQEQRSIEKETFNKLIAIRDLKVQQLENWLDEKLGDIQVMAGDFEIRGLENIFEKKLKSPEDIKKIQIATGILNRNLKYYGDYSEIFAVCTNTGLVEIGTNPSSIGKNKSHDPYFKIPLETGEIYIKDIYYSNSTNRTEMTISTPIFCLEHNKHIIGILVTRINLEKSLYNLLLNRGGLGETGETLIVNEDVMALNDLRWYEEAPLKLQINAKPAIKASQGKTGITQSTDYRGEEVLAAYTNISRTGWGLICKQDMYELNAPIRILIKNFSILLIVSVIIIVLIVFWISKRISKPILDMNIVAHKIKAGDYSVRNLISSGDELGSLAGSINEMVSSIESRNAIQKGVGGISEGIVGQTSMQNYGSKLLKLLIEITAANMGTFYILNEESLEFQHFASIGANKKLLQSFSSKNLEGEFGNAILDKNIYYLRDIPENTIFKFKTVGGEAIPKEIITIPIIIESDVVAIISLVNIKKFSNDALEIIKQSWMNISSSYSSLLGNERTRILAEHLSKTNQYLEATTEELQEQTEELQEQSEELQNQTEALQEQNLELEHQRKHVEEANRMKSEFLSNMSHELRTPLNSILALSRVLIMQSKEKLNDEENNYLEIVERNGKQLLSLINDILDLSKIESGKMDIHPEFTSIAYILNIIKENMQSLADEKSLVINLQIPENLPKAETDENRLHQAILNIVSNAVKFTKIGSVDISVKNDQENIFIEVKDTGIGISAKHLPYIFNEFRQVDGSTSRQFEGTGLGLAIASKMIKILGGNIKVESKLGEGSVFRISLPIIWQDKSEFPQDLKLKDIITKKESNTILVVDDDQEIIKNISKYLEESGYKTINATTGKEALKLAAEIQPFAITLDVLMPKMDGWEILQGLKSKPNTKDIPIIIVSISDDKETGFALGADGYIQKPVNKQILLSEIYKLKKTPDLVMIIDDNKIDLEQMSEHLKAERINTILAGSGKECIELLKKQIPNVLVLDLLMPEVDGFMVLENIRKNPKLRELPVIIVTAKDLTKEDKKSLSGNVSSILLKSDTIPRKLFKEVKRILKELEKPTNITEKSNSKIRILIVEDNEASIIQVKNILEKEGYVVDVALGGREALKYMKETIPDGIILDLMMPDVDGFEVLEKIRNTKRTGSIPVLILTAKDINKDDLKKLRSNNIQQLIFKGDIDKNGLLQKIKLMLDYVPSKKSKNIKIEKEENGDIEISIKGLKKIKNVSNSDTPHVLVVEDNPDNMTTIKAILSEKFNMGYPIISRDFH